MAMLKVQAEDIEALLSIADAYRGVGPAHFTDGTRTALRPFYVVAIQNCQAALDQSKRPKATRPVRRSAP
jgi:hypothetical protein